MEHDQPHTAADTTQTQDLDGPAEDVAMLAAPYEDERLPYDELADDETMPTRPRRKLLTPLTAGLAALLLGAVGFWLGVKVQKEHGSSTAGATAAGFTARKATSGKATSAGGFTPPGTTASGGGETTGEVAYIKGNTLYVTDSEDNTVKVATTPATSVSHTVTTKSISAIHPGDTITVQGSKSTSGAIAATSVTLSTATSSTGTTKSATSSTGTSTLFGEG
jgi:hypothetical protein